MLCWDMVSLTAARAGWQGERRGAWAWRSRSSTGGDEFIAKKDKSRWSSGSQHWLSAEEFTVRFGGRARSSECCFYIFVGMCTMAKSSLSLLGAKFPQLLFLISRIRRNYYSPVAEKKSANISWSPRDGGREVVILPRSSW